jgi:hypothetical protein
MATPEASGSFRQYPLPKLLFYLYRKQFTGSLFVQGGATVYLRDGIPVSSDDAGEGETIEEIAQARKQHTLADWTQLFALEDAEFALYRGGHEFGASREEARLLRLHPRRVIYHGIREAYDVARIWRELGGALEGQSMRIGAEATQSLARYRFTADDQELINKLTAGYWTPTNLIAATGADDVAAWRLLYAMHVTGMLDLRPHDDESSISLPPRPMATPAAPEHRPGTYRFSKKTLPPDVRAERIDLPETPVHQGVTKRASEADKVRAKIEATTQVLISIKDHDLLGVAPDATREQIKAAYVSQKRIFDPDRLGLLKLEELRDDAARISGAIEAAYATLIRPFVEADRAIEDGLEAMKQRQYAAAERYFRRALELRPDDAGASEGLRLALKKKGSLFGRTRKKDRD